MYSSFVSLFSFISIFGMCFCDEWDDAEQQRLIDNIIPDLYLRYRKALDSSDESPIVFRRVLRNNKRYNIHLNKLKDVHGFKRHNLIVKEASDDNPLIYVNNPVETKIPNPYLTLEGFKDLLMGRVLRQREEFNKQMYETFATLKTVQHLTSKQNNAVHITKAKEKLTKLKRSRIISTKSIRKKKIAAITKKMTIDNVTVRNNHDNNKTKQTTKAITVATDVIADTMTNMPTLDKVLKETNVSRIVTNEVIKSSFIPNMLPEVENVVSTNPTDQIGTLSIVANNVANISTKIESIIKTDAIIHDILHTTTKEYIEYKKTAHNNEKNVTSITTTPKTDAMLHHILRNSSKEDTEDDEVENTTDSVTNVSSAMEKTLSTDVIITIKDSKSQEEREMATLVKENIGLSTVFNLGENNTEQFTSRGSITEKHTTREFTIEYSAEQSTADIKKSSIESLATENFTIAEITTVETTITKPITEESTTKRRPPVHTRGTTIKTPKRPAPAKATTVPTTTKKVTKRTTLARPLVFMGGWDNSN